MHKTTIEIFRKVFTIFQPSCACGWIGKATVNRRTVKDADLLPGGKPAASAQLKRHLLGPADFVNTLETQRTA